MDTAFDEKSRDSLLFRGVLDFMKRGSTIVYDWLILLLTVFFLLKVVKAVTCSHNVILRSIGKTSIDLLRKKIFYANSLNSNRCVQKFPQIFFLLNFQLCI